MMKLIGQVIVITSMVFAATAHAAGGWTANEVPVKVEIVRGQGFMIFGSYGDPGNTPCGTDNGIWVPKEHTQYAELLSTALSAFAGQFKLQAYVHTCVNIGWHGGEYNQLSNSGALYISR
ncbi:MAG: hypothetical protein ABJN65_00980 [Parasphingorhabdus sp.]